jgi:hypothetical protein
VTVSGYDDVDDVTRERVFPGSHQAIDRVRVQDVISDEMARRRG